MIKYDMKNRLIFFLVIITLLMFSCPENIPDLHPTDEYINTLAGKGKEQAEWGIFVPNIPNNIGNTFTADPKTTRTIIWQSTINKGEVIIGKEHYPSVISSRGSIFHHRVVINNLEPGKTYNYIAGSEGYYSPVYSFTTESNSSGNFSVIHITDTHITTSKSDAGVWKRVIESAAGKSPEAAFVIHTGDVVEDAAAEAIPFYFDYAHRILANNAFMYSLGNNDLTDWYNVYFYAPNTGNGGILYYFNYGNALFINVDSNITLTQTQLNRLESYLKNTTQKWKVVITHQADYGRSGNNTNLTKLFDKYNVDLVMAGHNHFYARSKPINTEGNAKANGTVWSIPNAASTKFNSTAGQSFLAVDKQPNLPMFSVFKFTDDNILLEAYTVNAEGTALLFDSYTIQH